MSFSISDRSVYFTVNEDTINEKITLNFNEATNEYSVIYKKDNETIIDSITFSESLINSRGATFGVFCTGSNKLTMPINMTMFQMTREGKSLGEIYDINSTRPLVMYFVWGTKIVIIVDRHIATNLQNIIENVYFKSPDEIYADLFGSKFTKNMNITKKKKELIANLSPNETLAYVDSQIDILTKILINILDNNPSIKNNVLQDLPNLQTFIDAYHSTNLLNIKNFDKCVNEIIETKGKVRDKQNDFYQYKDSLK